MKYTKSLDFKRLRCLCFVDWYAIKTVLFILEGKEACVQRTQQSRDQCQLPVR